MKTYNVIYEGNSTRFRDFREEVYAESERKAVEMVYQRYLDSNYFPQDDGSIKDCDGNEIARCIDQFIEYDGGYFIAEEI